MFAALKDVLLEVYCSKLLNDMAKNQNNNQANMSSNILSNGINNEHAQFVGPYKLEKTLGKGQTGM